MCARFEEWKDSIRHYCEENGLSYQKACEMAKGANEDMLILQFHDPAKGKMGLLDETPMPAVLFVFREGNGVRIEKTEFTEKYLAQ